ncbi:hypothetical protein K1719_043966 [Acacia pycnantha]|nr:hypothetical protein K1719_043966 [Acacia pycnantha]
MRRESGSGFSLISIGGRLSCIIESFFFPEAEDKISSFERETVATSQHAWTLAMGVPIQDSAINTIPTIPEEIAECDDEESNPDEDASPMVNNQLKRENDIKSNE